MSKRSYQNNKPNCVLLIDYHLVKWHNTKLHLNLVVLKMASNSIKDSVYKMTSNPLGFCIIINIVNIDGHEELTRNDSIENVISIWETFEQLKFKVIIFQDLNDTEIFSKLNQLLNREECKSHDCFVLYIHSHGKENGFITTNNEIIEYHKIYELLLNSKCQKFIRKPKLLFFDCCRGERYSVDITQVDGYYSNTHLYSDLYVCYSTLKSKFLIIYKSIQ